MRANKGTKSSSNLTVLRVERAKIQSELDRLNDCVRETRNTKNPFSNNEERIKIIENRLIEINSTIRANIEPKKGLFKKTMFHSPKKSKNEEKDMEQIMAGINQLPPEIQNAVALQVTGKTESTNTTGATRKVYPIIPISENDTLNDFNGIDQNNGTFSTTQRPNQDIDNWDLEDLYDDTNKNPNNYQSVRKRNISKENQLKHEMEQLRQARLELKREQETFSQMRASLSISTENNKPQSTFTSIYTRPTQQTTTSSMPNPFITQNQLMFPYGQQYQVPFNFVPYPMNSMQNIPLAIPNTVGIQNIPITIPNTMGLHHNSSVMPNIHTTPNTTIGQYQQQHHHNNTQSNTRDGDCRKTFLKHLDSIPSFSGDSREQLMNFLEVNDILDNFKINESENRELLMKISLQLRGEARNAILNVTDWREIKTNLLRQFHYLSNRDILNSKIENLKQEKNETLIQYTEKTRKLLIEKNKSYNQLNNDQKLEHDRITRKAFIRGITNYKLRDTMQLRGATSLEEAISLSIELENETKAIIPNKELFCTFCKFNGHREHECRKKEQQDSTMNKLINAMQQVKTQNNYNNKTTERNQYSNQQNPFRNSFNRDNNTQNTNNQTTAYQNRNWSNNNTYNNNGNTNRPYTENTNGAYAGNNNNQRRNQNYSGNQNTQRNVNMVDYYEQSDYERESEN